MKPQSGTAATRENVAGSGPITLTGERGMTVAPLTSWTAPIGTGVGLSWGRSEKGVSEGPLGPLDKGIGDWRASFAVSKKCVHALFHRHARRLALARLLRKFFQNLRYGRERPKVARKLRSLAGGGVSDTKVAKTDAIVLPSHLYGKLLIPYTVSTYHWERPTAKAKLLDPPAFRRVCNV